MRTLSHAPTKRRRGTRRLMVGGGLTEMRLDVLDAKRFVGSSWNLLTERGSFDHSFPFSSLLLTTEKRFREMPSIRLFIPFSIPFSWFSNTRERHIHTFVSFLIKARRFKRDVAGKPEETRLVTRRMVKRASLILSPLGEGRETVKHTAARMRKCVCVGEGRS